MLSPSGPSASSRTFVTNEWPQQRMSVTPATTLNSTLAKPSCLRRLARHTSGCVVPMPQGGVPRTWFVGLIPLRLFSRDRGVVGLKGLVPATGEPP